MSKAHVDGLHVCPIWIAGSAEVNFSDPYESRRGSVHNGDGIVIHVAVAQVAHCQGYTAVEYWRIKGG